MTNSSSRPLNFALIGVGGYIAPRHLRAIRDTGNRLIAAADPKDSVGVLDQYDFNVKFFTEIERFDRHLEKLRRGPTDERMEYLTVCSPNYLHDAHCRLGLRLGADVICEKPLVINPWNLDALQDLEQETGHHINTILQLRVHPELMKLKQTLEMKDGKHHEVILTYITGRATGIKHPGKGRSRSLAGLPPILVSIYLICCCGCLDELEIFVCIIRMLIVYRVTLNWSKRMLAGFSQ